MPDKDIVKIKRVADISDEVKRKDVMRKLIGDVGGSMTRFQDAYTQRRNELLELNSLYRNKSYYDTQRAQWQTRAFLPHSFNSVEKKTSILHESLWANRFSAPFSVIGRTEEDHLYATSAEAVLNNTMDTIGFYESSEECLRSVSKFGLGVYRHGWLIRTEENLIREVLRDDKGAVKRNKAGKPIYNYRMKPTRISRPFVRSVDIVDHFGYDPSAKRISKWECDFAYEITEETPEIIWEKEQTGEYDEGSYEALTRSDPHGINSLGLEVKEPKLKQDDGVAAEELTPKTRYAVVHWEGWFDVDGDGRKEFIKVGIADNRVILYAQTSLIGEYSFVDCQYSRSIHSLTPWGVLDPVKELQYEINEQHNMRGDYNKIALNPQTAIDVDKIFDDHSYVTFPGAQHPFSGLDGRPVRDAFQVIAFPQLQHISWNEEDRNANLLAETTGVIDFAGVLAGVNKNTPASTMISILNEMQAGNSMIVNGVLNRHGVLGSRVLRSIQLFGDEEFIVRVAGKRGLQFRRESLENILGEFDVKVTTSSFFGNKQVELQHLIQLKPMWAQMPHIDQVELDRAILENIMPKRVDRILNVPAEPLSALEEQTLFIYGQGEGLKVSDQESLGDLRFKLQLHQQFRASKLADLKDETRLEWDRFLAQIQDRVEELEIQRQAQAAQGARGMGGVGGPGAPAGPGGRVRAPGFPEVRMQGEQIRPTE